MRMVFPGVSITQTIFFDDEPPGLANWQKMETNRTLQATWHWRVASLSLIGFLQLSITAAEQRSPAPPIIRGPFYSGTIKALYPGPNIAMKGIVVTVDEEKKAYVCYDTDLLRVSLAWTGDYLEFGNGQTEISHPQPPSVKGTPVFGTRPGPGWAKGDVFIDPRPRHQGPLPRDWAKYRGLYVNGNNVVLSYTVGDCQVLEMPGVEFAKDGVIFTRTFQLGKSSAPLSLLVAELNDATGGANSAGSVERSQKTGLADRTLAVLTTTSDVATNCIAAGQVEAPQGSAWETGNGHIYLKLPALKETSRFKLRIWGGAHADLQKIGPALTAKTEAIDLAALSKGGPARWTQPIITKGVVGADDKPYTVDTLTEPVPNPWNAKTFFGGFDFFPDGRAAICAFHGDVWIVSGIDDKLEKLTWKRYAAGLFQALGLKIVDNKIYVLGRDQITRLHDLNNDGEADFYENFNNDTVVTPNYHEFCLDLDTDSHGNFYFCKGAPWVPSVDSPHQGCLFRVPKDGSRLEIIATGFRAPNGMAIGPHDEITVSDNQGHWMPSSKLNWIKPGGFYGMTPAAHRELKLQRGGTNFVADPSEPADRARFRFLGWDAGSPMPEGYDQPFCWLPQNVDNSSGGQVWATSNRWGPLQNDLLFLSYGKCTLFHVMTEVVEGQRQGGMVQFPLKFYSGLMRGRCNARDGQIYLSGLRGWQTSGVKDGGFYRVRYTGKPVQTAKELHVRKNGLQIEFTSPLEAASATDMANWSVDRWNYIWSGQYGSPEVSVEDPAKQRHDPVEVKAIGLSADKKTLLLEIPGLRPAMQMKIKYRINAADGTPIAEEIYNTIHRVPGA
ncbi:MAG: hypothetical protein DME26_18295 [Verrucomicrobia bacterium]|nr:MAG: hypothetical protein DME26_18295 [Verrucomicrobiota bacterium]